jgi:Cu2+-containing amine oxidase
MNMLLHLLAKDSLDSSPKSATKLAVEDNVGESIHIHIRNVRLEMSIDDYMEFADEVESAAGVIRSGDR